MNIYALKTLQNKQQSAAHSVVQKQHINRSNYHFEDNRPEAIAQRKLQKAMNNNQRPNEISGQLPSPATQLMENTAQETVVEKVGVVQRSEHNGGLPEQLKLGVERLSGYSMDDVKVHYNSAKPGQLQAHAFAQGSAIHLAPGQEKHLPHEAWHVVQQKQGRVKATKQLKSKININDDAKLEGEADLMGEKAAQASVLKGVQLKRLTPKSSTVTTAQRKISVHSKNDGKVFNKRADKVKRRWNLTRAQKKIYNAWLIDDVDRHFHDIETLKSMIKRHTSGNRFYPQQGLPQGEGDSGGIKAMISKFGSMKGIREFYSSVTSGPRVKRHNTSAWITSRIKNADYTKIYVPIQSIRSQHSIDGVAVGNTEQRAAKILGWLDKNPKAVSMDMETLNELAGSTGSIKVGWNSGNGYITLDGVGRLEAIRKALKDLGKASQLKFVETYAIKMSDYEFTQLHHTSGFFRDEMGKQKQEYTHDLYKGTALPRFVLGTGMNLIKNVNLPLLGKIGDYLSPIPDRKIPIQ